MFDRTMTLFDVFKFYVFLQMTIEVLCMCIPVSPGAIVITGAFVFINCVPMERTDYKLSSLPIDSLSWWIYYSFI